MTLIEFLLARIDEDEADARVAMHLGTDWTYTPGSWQIGEAWQGVCEASDAGHGVLPHIARWNPERVLAECAAKRRLLARAKHADELTDFSGSLHMVDMEYVEQILPTLALPYADHPDYNEEWRP